MKILTSEASLRAELLNQKMIRIELCSEEENNKYKEMEAAGIALPNGVFRQFTVSDMYSRIIPSDLSDTQELSLIEAAKLLKVSAIHKWLVFWGVLTIVSLIGGLIALLVILS